MYDWALEPLLKKIKKKVAKSISRYKLFPVLDICCGTGKQCHLIGVNKNHIFGLDSNLKTVQYASFKYRQVTFICADAAQTPLKSLSFKGIVISFALHDKRYEVRKKILAESKRLLIPGGKIILVDFETPWGGLSKFGEFFVYWIERMAGKEHFRNGREFLRQGGLRAFLKQNGWIEIERHNIAMASSSIVITQFS